MIVNFLEDFFGFLVNLIAGPTVKVGKELGATQQELKQEQADGAAKTKASDARAAVTDDADSVRNDSFNRDNTKP